MRDLVRGTIIASALLVLGAAPPATKDDNWFGLLGLLIKPIAAFLGNGHGTYFWKGGDIAEQAIAGMNNPRAPIDLPNGNRLAWGCRPHSCDEMAGAIISPRNEVRAVALIHYPCAFGEVEIIFNCPDAARLTIFVKRRDADPAYSEAFEEWAYREVAEFGDDDKWLTSVQTKVLP
ncbi:MAG: hypothetical protein JWN69_2519 [Alphaproteobacteria bacterium]|nr:hypothetical protein [Alphaproteobacteria bacterium]